jgi:UDPglucose 6-dehydrogenase
MSNTKDKRIKVGIVGVGMVGEPLKRWFEERLKYRRGKDLFCYDTDPKKGYTDDVNKASVIFVAVPTPANPDGSCNTLAVRSVADAIDDGKIVVIKSTIEPGTVEELQKKYPRKKFIFNPEFLTESQAWIDFVKPDRQLVAYTSKSRGDAREILALLPQAHFERPWASDYTKKEISATEAELAKYASNVFGYIKVIYGNILADFCHALTLNLSKRKIDARVDYENVKEVISADPRIGPAWLNVGHGNYCGVGGYCLDPSERLFVYNGNKFRIISAKDISNKVVSILGWKNGKVIKDKISVLGKRVADSMIRFALSKGRSLTVTPDHLVIVSDEKGNLSEKCAKDVSKDDYLPVVLDGLSLRPGKASLEIYSYVNCDKERVLVEKVPQSFADTLKPHLTFNELADFRRKAWRAVPLKACLNAAIDISGLRIKTGTSGTWIPAVIELDNDFARFLGYYLAEGCITNNRILLSFNVNEKDLIEDVKGILDKLRIKFSTRVFDWKGKPSTFTFKISSKVFSSYLSQICGLNSYNKQIPHFVFEASQSIKDNLLAGLLRGDGSIEKSNSGPGPYYTINYATTSQILAEGTDMLLREKGILASVKKIHTTKTKVDAWSLNISEVRNVQEIARLFTERQRLKVSPVYFERKRTILSPAYKKIKNLALLSVRQIQKINKRTEAISLDTANHLYITSWGILTHNCFPKDMSALIKFAENLTSELSGGRGKDKADTGLIKSLKKGIEVLKAAVAYNKTILEWQGLTMEDVSRHDKEVIVNKRKPIRTHGKSPKK